MDMYWNLRDELVEGGGFLRMKMNVDDADAAAAAAAAACYFPNTSMELLTSTD